MIADHPSNPEGEPARAAAARAGGSQAATSLREFLAFRLGAEEYGIDILRVQEIRCHERLRPVPEFNSAIESEHLLAIGAIDPRLLILFDIERLITSTEMGLVEKSLNKGVWPCLQHH